MCLRPAALVVLSAVLACAGEGGSAGLLAAWAKDPARHPNIPDFSYAGYRNSEQPLPTPQVVVNVRDQGAKGDGQADDSDAFNKAIQAAAKAGGGAVLVPAGDYRITKLIELNQSGVVLRGEDRDRTVLVFEKSLEDIKGKNGTRWSWYGALIWCELARDAGGGGGFSAARLMPAAQGETMLEVEGGGLGGAAGQMAEIRWTGDISLCHEIGGDPAMQNADWNGWAAFKGGQLTFTWPTRIVAAQGGKVQIKKPLRLPVKPAWQVEIRPAGAMLQESGIERMTLRMPPHSSPGHLKDPGFNGVFLRRCADCFVRDVTILNTDNGVIVDGSTQCTVTGLRIAEGRNHHGTMCRDGASDNLIQDFLIESQPHHGINTEGLSSGNVWRKGMMKHGTFDSHCAVSFDSLRCDIELNSDGTPGGAGDAGPFLGRRMVHWNIRLTGGNSEWCFAPAVLPAGAIVGGQGGPINTKDSDLWHLPKGPKGCIVVDHGQAPAIPDLFLAQLERRMGAAKPAARDKPAEKAADKPRTPAQPAAKTIAFAVQERWNQTLAERLRKALAAGRKLRVDVRMLGGEADITAVDERGALALRSPQGGVQLPLSGLDAKARASLAVAVAGQDADGAACAAFHLLAAGDAAGRAQLAKAGAAAAALRKDLGLEEAPKSAE